MDEKIREEIMRQHNLRLAGMIWASDIYHVPKTDEERDRFETLKTGASWNEETRSFSVSGYLEELQICDGIAGRLLWDCRNDAERMEVLMEDGHGDIETLHANVCRYVDIFVRYLGEDEWGWKQIM